MLVSKQWKMKLVLQLICMILGILWASDDLCLQNK